MLRSALQRFGVVGVVLALTILYATFEFGRYEGGFRVIDSVRGALAASARIRSLEAENADQRRQLEAVDVARRVDREGYGQVQRSLGDMQSQIARLNQDLSFYRGLVQPDSLIHVKVQQMQIVPETPAGQFRLKFVLMQTGKPDKEVNGNVNLIIDGLLQGKPLSLSFAQASTNRRIGLAYSFKYFQDYDEAIQLPQGFEPTRVGVDIHSGKDTVQQLSASLRLEGAGHVDGNRSEYRGRCQRNNQRRCKCSNRNRLAKHRWTP